MARGTCHSPRADPGPVPSPFRHSGASNIAYPVPIGPPVWPPRPEMLEHTNRQTNTLTAYTRVKTFGNFKRIFSLCQFCVSFDLSKWVINPSKRARTHLEESKLTESKNPLLFSPTHQRKSPIINRLRQRHARFILYDFALEAGIAECNAIGVKIVHIYDVDLVCTVGSGTGVNSCLGGGKVGF